MKSINNLNTLNALIRDENMASKEYYALSKDKKIPGEMQMILRKMSKDEMSHKEHLIKYKKWLREERK